MRALGEGLDVLHAAGFGEVADILLALAADDAVSPEVYEKVCRAVFVVLEAWSDLR